MSVHIGAKKGEIAEKILLPGDPMRAKYVAETFLEDVVCYNEVRGMLGFTGSYKGKRISVQGTGMGIPSISIYVTELIREFGCQELIRIGTAGSFQKSIHIKDIVLGMAASTTSATNSRYFPGDFAATADFSLLERAVESARSRNLNVVCGNILSGDLFYDKSEDDWKRWAEYNVLAVEMEANALYTIAARYGAKALAILTISDSLVQKEPELTSQEREKSLNEMIETALIAI